MANLDADDGETDLSKHDKLVNAWLAAGRDANVETVASLTDASPSYASQVRQAMEEGDLSEDEVEATTVPALVDRYEERVEAAATGAETADGGSAESESENAENGAGASETPQGAPEQRHQRPSQSPDENPRPSSGRGRQGPYRRGEAPVQRQPPQPPRPPQRPPANRPPPQQEDPASQQRSGRAQTDPTRGREPVQGEDGLYVPAGDLAEMDETLAVLEDEARFQVENLPPNQPQYQVALAKLYVARQARSLVGDAADDAVPADEV